MVMLVMGEVRVEFRLLLISGQVRLYPVAILFCSTRSAQTNVTLCEKKVVLEQLIGGDAGAMKKKVKCRE